MIEPFALAISERELDDLRGRLHATRWPEPATDPRQGVTLEHLQQRCAFWASHYDWRATERQLNAVPQFMTTIDGLKIHFLHARSSRSDAFPLILTHGWPGSVVEFLDVLPSLTDEGFHCVVPDCGTSVSASLGEQDPEHVAGIHLMPPLAPSTTARRHADDDTGYSVQQRTRPETVGYALTDSPAGLAAWIGEKLDSWADPRTPIPETRILDTLMLYWLPRAAA